MIGRPNRLRCPYPGCARKVADWSPSLVRHLHQWHHVPVSEARIWALRFTLQKTDSVAVVHAVPRKRGPQAEDPSLHGPLRALLHVSVNAAPSIARPTPVLAVDPVPLAGRA